MSAQKKEPEEIDTILVLNMFSGSYQEKNLVANTAHETMNLFAIDKQDNIAEFKYYIYAPKNGKIQKKIDSRRSRHITKVLMVRYLDCDSKNGPWRYEVIGRAFVESDLKNVSQRDLFNHITYGGVPLPEILRAGGQPLQEISSSEYTGEYTEKITFGASRCETPVHTHIIECLSGDPEDQKGQSLAGLTKILVKKKTGEGYWKLFGEDQKRYFEKQLDTCEQSGEIIDEKQLCFDPYKQLNELFKEGAEEWEAFKSVNAIEMQEKSNERTVERKSDPRFLKLINKEDSELAYSNLLAYFLNRYEPLFKRLVSSLLNKAGETELKEVDLLPLDIAREKNHIDLLINTEGAVFIIENKVEAELDDSKYEPKPPKKKKDPTQEEEQEYNRRLNEYRQKLDAVKRENAKENTREKLAEGQLQRYIDAVLDELDQIESQIEDGERGTNNKKIYTFLLCPTRNRHYQEYLKHKNNDEGGLVRTVITDRAGKEISQVPVVSYNELLAFLGCDTEMSFEATLSELGIDDAREREYFKDFIAMLRWQESVERKDQSKFFLKANQQRFLRTIKIAKELNQSSNG